MTSSSDREHIFVEIASLGWDDLLEFILKREKIDINARNSEDQVALYRAACAGHECTVRLLLAQDDVDVNVQNFDGETPLHGAIIYARPNYPSVVKLLLDREDIDLKFEHPNRRGYIAWFHAARYNCSAALAQF